MQCQHLPDCHAAAAWINFHFFDTHMAGTCHPVALLLAGLVCVHAVHALGPDHEESLYDITRHALSGSGSTTRAVSSGLSSTHHGPHSAPMVATCLKQTQWKHCRAIGSMASEDSAVLSPPVITPGNDTATSTLSPGVKNGIASGIYFQ